MNQRLNIRLGLLWSLATTATGIGIDTLAWMRLSDWFDSLILSLVGTLILMGAVQWLLLRTYRLLSRWWIIATAVGGVLGWVIGWIAAILTAFIVGRFADAIAGTTAGDTWGGIAGWVAGGLFGGTVLGLAQWLVLRASVQSAAWWIPTTAIASAVAGLIGANLSRTLNAFGKLGGWTATITSVILFSLITGSVLIWLVARGTVQARIDKPSLPTSAE